MNYLAKKNIGKGKTTKKIPRSPIDTTDESDFDDLDLTDNSSNSPENFFNIDDSTDLFDISDAPAPSTHRARAVVDPAPSVIDPAHIIIDNDSTPLVIQSTPAVIDPTPAVIDPTPTAPTPAATHPTPAISGRFPQIQLDDDCIDKDGYYAVYYEAPKLTYYWGKITKTFSDDDMTDINAVEVDFLKKKTISSNINEWNWAVPNPGCYHEISIINAKYVFYGPVVPKKHKGILYFPEHKVWNTLLGK